MEMRVPITWSIVNMQPKKRVVGKYMIADELREIKKMPREDLSKQDKQAFERFFCLDLLIEYFYILQNFESKGKSKIGDSTFIFRSSLDF